MIECEWLNDSNCGLAEQLTGVPVPCPPGACDACRTRHPITPTTDSPGTVVASLATRYGSPAVGEAMRSHLLVESPPKLVQLTLPKKESVGVGAEVSQLLKSLGIPPCQQCAEFAAWMDEIGIAGCEMPENRDKILKRLRDKAAEATWATKLKAAALTVTTGLAFRIDVTDPIPGILDEAIRIAKQKQPPPITIGSNPLTINTGEGRGIVIPGGGIYLKSAWVTIRMVRHFGCELPIELWLLPWETVTTAERSAVEAYGVTVKTLEPGYCLNEKIASKLWRKPIYLGGWQSKVQAVLQSSFSEVIYLDADCYPVEAGWLEKLTETGEATFLGDVVESNVLLTDAACESFGVPHGVPVDSGAFFVSKESTAWCDIVAAINGPEMVREFYGDILFGDKDTWWMAHHLAGVTYRILDRGKMIGGASYIRHGCGLLHRTGCKFTDGEPINTPQHGRHTVEGDNLTATILRGWPPLEVRGARDAELLRGVIELDEYRLDKTGQMSFIVDGGGHIGSFSVAALRRWPAAKIIAVEPDAQNCELFRKNVTSSNVTLVEAALGEDNGTVGLSANAGDTAYQTTATGTIPRRRLSDLVTAAGWDRIDLLKLDIEGDECLVISDLIEAGMIRKVGRIVGEWHTPAIREELVELLRPTHHLTVCSHRWEHGYFDAVRNDQP